MSHLGECRPSKDPVVSLFENYLLNARHYRPVHCNAKAFTRVGSFPCPLILPTLKQASKQAGQPARRQESAQASRRASKQASKGVHIAELLAMEEAHREARLMFLS
jgi:hypothetical protein